MLLPTSRRGCARALPGSASRTLIARGDVETGCRPPGEARRCSVQRGNPALHRGRRCGPASRPTRFAICPRGSYKPAAVEFQTSSEGTETAVPLAFEYGVTDREVSDVADGHGHRIRPTG